MSKSNTRVKVLFLLIFSILFLLQCLSKFILIVPFQRIFSAQSNDSLTREKFWRSIKPSLSCPPQLLTKTGGDKDGDGGKWTCGLSNLGKLISPSPSCVVYSFGVNKDSSFEAEVLATTHCEVYAYDPTVEKIGKPLKPSNPRVHFEKMGLGGKNSTRDFKTLKTFMERNGGHQWIDILKIDVEGAEYKSLARILDDFPDDTDIGLPFGQLLVEMHVNNYWNMGPSEKFSHGTESAVVNLFERLERRGLRMFNVEVNPLAKYCCSEFSFINIKPFSLNRFLLH